MKLFVLSFVALVPIVWATPPGTIITKHPSNLEKGAKGCAEFSGNWQGSCSTQQGQTYDYNASIRQIDCQHLGLTGTSPNPWIEFGPAFLRPGGSFNRGLNDDLNRLATSQFLDWNQDQTKARLLIEYTDHYPTYPIPNKDIRMTNLSVYLFREGKSLRIQIRRSSETFNGEFGKPAIEEDNLNCSLELAQKG